MGKLALKVSDMEVLKGSLILKLTGVPDSVLDEINYGDGSACVKVLMYLNDMANNIERRVHGQSATLVLEIDRFLGRYSLDGLVELWEAQVKNVTVDSVAHGMPDPQMAELLPELQEGVRIVACSNSETGTGCILKAIIQLSTDKAEVIDPASVLGCTLKHARKTSKGKLEVQYPVSEEFADYNFDGDPVRALRSIDLHDVFDILQIEFEEEPDSDGEPEADEDEDEGSDAGEAETAEAAEEVEAPVESDATPQPVPEKGVKGPGKKGFGA